MELPQKRNQAHEAPQNQSDDLIRGRLSEMFKPVRRAVYEAVLPLPRLEDVADRVRVGRVLLIVSQTQISRPRCEAVWFS